MSHIKNVQFHTLANRASSISTTILGFELMPKMQFKSEELVNLFEV